MPDFDYNIPVHLRLVGVAGPLLRDRPLDELWRPRGVETPLLCSDTNVGDAGAAGPPCSTTIAACFVAKHMQNLVQ
jgi:hypothetical protein